MAKKPPAGAVLNDPPDELAELYYRIIALDGEIATAMRQIVWGSGKDKAVEAVEEVNNLTSALLDAVGQRVSHMARFLALATRQGIGLKLLQEALLHAKLDTTLLLDPSDK